MMTGRNDGRGLHVRHGLALLASLTLALLPACGDGGGITITEDDEEEDPTVAGVRFVTQPQDVIPGETFTVSVELLAGDGSRATFSSDPVSLSASGGVTLNGPTAVSATSGLATFQGLSIADPGSNLRLTASTSGHSAQSQPFSVLDPCEVNVGSLAPGELADGTLEPGDCALERLFAQFSDNHVDRWELVLDQQTSLQVDLTSTDFDALLLIMDDQGTLVSFDDDGGEGLNSRITQHLGPGGYVIVATTFNAGESGAYRLRLTTVPACDAVAGLIFPDQTSRGDLRSEDCSFTQNSRLDFWKLDLSDPAVLQVTLESDAFAPFVGAFTAAGENQVTGAFLNDPGSVTVEHVLPASIFWLFVSNGTDTGSPPSGSYTLTTSSPVSEPNRGCPEFSTQAAPGAVASGRITTDDCESGAGRSFDGYTVRLSAGETMSVTLGADFEFLFQLQSGQEVLQSLRNVPAGETRTIEYTADPGGFFTFYVAAEQVGTTGEYEMSFSETAGSAPPAGPVAGRGGRVRLAPTGPDDGGALRLRRP